MEVVILCLPVALLAPALSRHWSGGSVHVFIRLLNTNPVHHICTSKNLVIAFRKQSHFSDCFFLPLFMVSISFCNFSAMSTIRIWKCSAPSEHCAYDFWCFSNLCFFSDLPFSTAFFSLKMNGSTFSILKNRQNNNTFLLYCLCFDLVLIFITLFCFLLC